MFNFLSSSTIVFLVQFFIFSNHWLLNFFFSFDFLYKFLNFLLYIFINFMISLFQTFHLLPPFQPFIFINSSVSLFSSFHLLLLFLFQLDFLINFFYFISTSLPYSFQVVHCKKGQFSLSLSNFVSFDAFFFPTTFSPIMVPFVVVDLIVTSHLFLFLANFYRLLCIFWYSNSRLKKKKIHFF